MKALLLFLLPFLFQLEYDDSRRVGDVVVVALHQWSEPLGPRWKHEDHKLQEQLQPLRGRPPIPEDGLDDQIALVDNLRTTIDLLDAPLAYMGSLGYRLPRPELKGLVTTPYDAWDLGRDANFLRVVFSPNGKRLALYDYRDGCITLWDVAHKKKLATLQKDGWTPSGEIAFAPDGKSLTARGQRIKKREGDSLSQDAVVVWDLKGYEEKNVADLELAGVGGWAALTPDGKTLVVAAPAGAAPGAVAYDAATGKQVKALAPDPSLRGPATAVAVSPDGKVFALGTTDGVILLWDLQKGTTRQVMPTGRANAPPPALAPLPNPPPDSGGQIELLTFSPDGKTLASYAGADGVVDLWDPATGKNVGVLHFDPWLPHLTALAFSPDGKTLAFGGRKGKAQSAVELWDLTASGFRDDCRAESKGRVAILFLAFSPNGRTLVTGAPKNPVEFWDVPAGKPYRIKPFAPTPEGQKAPPKP
jgi:WD40 repeat protein